MEVLLHVCYGKGCWLEPRLWWLSRELTWIEAFKEVGREVGVGKQ